VPCYAALFNLPGHMCLNECPAFRTMGESAYSISVQLPSVAAGTTRRCDLGWSGPGAGSLFPPGGTQAAR